MWTHIGKQYCDKKEQQKTSQCIFVQYKEVKKITRQSYNVKPIVALISSEDPLKNDLQSVFCQENDFPLPHKQTL